MSFLNFWSFILYMFTFMQILVQSQGKKEVKNKMYIEASICKTYIVEEILTFITYYDANLVIT